MKPLTIFSALAFAITALTSSIPSGAQAQAPEYMSCGALWRARNEIYARNGHCFSTARGRAVFGGGCFPPYGQLRGRERSRVNEIQIWERRKGC